MAGMVHLVCRNCGVNERECVYSVWYVRVQVKFYCMHGRYCPSCMQKLWSKRERVFTLCGMLECKLSFIACMAGMGHLVCRNCGVNERECLLCVVC